MRFLPRLAPPAIAPGADPGFELTKPSPLEERVQKIFIGRDGLRPVWRLVLYFLMYRGLRFCLFVLLAYGLSDALFLWRQTAAEFGLAIIALAPALLMSRIEGRPFGCYGLPPGKAFGKLFWVGALWGMVSLTLLLLALRGAHAFYFGAFALHGGRALKFAVVLGCVLPDRCLLRRILHPRVYAIYADRNSRLLAGGDFAFAGFRGAASGKSRERAGWAFSAPW